MVLTWGGMPLGQVRDVSDPGSDLAALDKKPRCAALIEGSRRSYRERGGVTISDIEQELAYPFRWVAPLPAPGSLGAQQTRQTVHSNV